MPRFIIIVREMYDRELRDRWEGIDAGFPVSSQHIVSESPAPSVIAFAEVAPGNGQIVERNMDEPQAIRLEGLGNSALPV